MIEQIVFAAGCFWGVEKHFSSLNGVVDVKSGYVGGNYENPNYEKVLEHRILDDKSPIINYTEGVLVKYDTKKTDGIKLIKSFWEHHDPTQLNRQGNDIGNNYRSAIFYTTPKQKYVALSTKDIYQQLLSSKGFGKIVTQIEPFEKFYDAEEYHQNYLVKNPNGYCPIHQTGVKFKNDEKEDKEIYKKIGEYKLGLNSEAYKVAFDKDTDRSFCKRYDLFKDTPDGVFIDIVSGEPLFDTKDRFNSGTGWLSFYKAVDGSTIEKEDLSYGMKRVEVLAKKSGIHLGHVFDEFGKRRFCINATVLEFVPRNDIK